MKTGTHHSEIGAPLQSLDAVPAALAICRSGSATGAARSLGVGVATILRRLEKLEQELGVRLFDRLQQGLLPTAAMERVLPWMEHIEASAQGVLRELAGLELLPEGVVRLATLPGLSANVLVPGLPELRHRYPDLILELLPASAEVDLTGRQADLALRLNRPTQGDLVAQQVSRFTLGAYAAPEITNQLVQLPPHEWPWLTWADTMAEQPESRWIRALAPDPAVVFRSTELDSLLAASVAGVGVVVVANALGESRGLVRLPVGGTAPAGGLWLVSHRALRHAPRVEAVWDWVVERLILMAE